MRGSLHQRIRMACIVMTVICASAHFVEGGELEPRINGFYIKKLPLSYQAREKLFGSLKGSGADTILIDMPANASGEPDQNGLQNAVYLTHQAGLRIFVVMPTRRDPAALERHPDWEDRAYNAVSRSLESADRLDIFRDDVKAHLVERSKQLASFFPDGIVLQDDFLLRTGDGLSRTAVQYAEAKLKLKVEEKKLPAAGTTAEGGSRSEQYSPDFWKWADLKKGRCVEVFDAMRTEARRANPSIRLFVPAPIVTPVASKMELLAKYSFDAPSYRSVNADGFWAHIAYHDMRSEQGLTFRDARTLLARSAQAAVFAVRDPEALFLVVQAVTREGRALPLSEIEEVTEIVRRAGRTGLVYQITPSAVPSSVMTRKQFQGGQ